MIEHRISNPGPPPSDDDHKANWTDARWAQERAGDASVEAERPLWDTVVRATEAGFKVDCSKHGYTTEAIAQSALQFLNQNALTLEQVRNLLEIAIEGER